jgi:hypothetical protein
VAVKYNKMKIFRSSQVRRKTKDYAYTKKGDISNHTHETHGYEIFFTLVSKILQRVLHISTTLALKYIFFKNSLENDVIAGKFLIFPSSLLVLLTTLVAWLWLCTIVWRRLYSMKKLEITSFPLSKFHIHMA